MEFSHHISQRFDAELEQLRSRLLAMGGLVETQLRTAVEALVTGDDSLARRVEELDDQVDQMELEIDDECLRILVRRQPAARDLRLVMAVMKAISDLERMGDEAERIARMCNRMQAVALDATMLGDLKTMGRGVKDMLHDALDAIARTDVAAAQAVFDDDDAIDAQFADITDRLVAQMAQKPGHIASLLDLLWAARALERIGDRSQNLCEYVIYLARGHDIRHSDVNPVGVSMAEVKA